MLTIGRVLSDIIPNDFSSLIAFHYPMPSVTPSFVVTTFDGLENNMSIAHQVEHVGSALGGSAEAFFDPERVRYYERHELFLRRLAILAPSITAAEQRVCMGVVDGLTTKEIASKLSLSERTVENHRLSIRKKLDVGERSLVSVLRILSTSDPA
jgi:DNA-binding CsgD family transcriptional regulator